MEAYQMLFRRHDKHTKFSYRYLTHPRERVLFSYSRNYSMIYVWYYALFASPVGAFVAFIGQNVRSEMENIFAWHHLSWARPQAKIPVVILFSNLTAASCKEKPFYIHQTHYFALYSKLQLAQGFIGFTVNTVVAAGAIDSLH